MPQKRVPLNRALSKLGLLSRSEAIEAILAGRVRVQGRIERQPGTLVVPEHVRIDIDDRPRLRARWRTLLVHKPRGVVVTRSDPEGRRTIYDVLGETEKDLIVVGRLDLATSGLLLMTNDTQLSNRITDPGSAVPRVYVITVRGRVDDADLDTLRAGVGKGSRRLQAFAVTVRKRSGRETHLTLELREGKNREVRRLFDAIGHEVTRLKRVRMGGLELGGLEPGQWRELSRAEVARVFEI